MSALHVITSRLSLIRLAAIGAAAVMAATAFGMPASGDDRAGHVSGHHLKAVTTVSAKLSGAKEVPGPGDPNGSGSVTIKLKPAVGKVCANAAWTRIGAPFAAHIHKGGPTVSGDVVVDLSGAVTGGSHCKATPRPAIRAIAAHPKRYYFNIHTDAYQAGAIRGQLHR